MGKTTNFPDGLTSQGVPVLGSGLAGLDPSGSFYFCDGNSGSDSNDGKSWKTAKKTLANVFALSHSDIARGADRWARRNTIFCAGDSFAEDLLILPQKTDVVGVGSYNGHRGPNLLGNHAPVNAGLGCRFLNFNFEPVTAGTIMTLVASVWGFQAVNCRFKASGTLVAVKAIDMTACPHTKILGCLFLGAFTGDVIDIGAGAVDEVEIRGNQILGGANDGIVVTGATTLTAGRKAIIADNFIEVAGKVIVDGDDDTIMVAGNRCVSAGANTGAAYEIDEGLAVDNVITYNDGTSVRVPIIPSA